MFIGSAQGLTKRSREWRKNHFHFQKNISDKLDHVAEMLNATLVKMKSDPSQSSVVIFDVQRAYDVIKSDAKVTKASVSTSVMVSSPKRSPQMKAKDVTGQRRVVVNYFERGIVIVPTAGAYSIKLYGFVNFVFLIAAITTVNFSI